MGGDEFAILLQRCSVENGIKVAENIRSTVEQMRVDWEGDLVSVGLSIGIVEVDESYKDVDSIMLAADSSCLIAKRQGRNHVRVYSSGDDAVKQRSDDLQWITLIEKALKEDRCLLYQQPITPLCEISQPAVHFEVLLRILDDDGQIVPPGVFLPCAERNGLIDGIDRKVVGKVLQWLNDQQANDELDLTVSVNLSGASIADPDFQEFLLTSISDSGISARHLCFEITESAAIQNLSSSAEFLARVRALGCRIALDDFGTGFASLEYIKQLPLDFIKIDGAFIREIVDNPLDQALVRCVSDVARILEVATVAEFVENDETIRELTAIGVDFAQGYFISKPKPLENLSTLLPAFKEQEAVH
jgi:Amt family ammonium transporter